MYVCNTLNQTYFEVCAVIGSRMLQQGLRNESMRDSNMSLIEIES
jgi:hypothetical protein